MIEIQKVLFKAANNGHLLLNEHDFIAAIEPNIENSNISAIVEKAIRLGII